jgi:hypothetical protein
MISYDEYSQTHTAHRDDITKEYVLDYILIDPGDWCLALCICFGFKNNRHYKYLSSLMPDEIQDSLIPRMIGFIVEQQYKEGNLDNWFYSIFKEEK